MEIKEARQVLRRYADLFDASDLEDRDWDADNLRRAARAPRVSSMNPMWRDYHPRAHDLHGDCGPDGRHCGEIEVCADGEREDIALEDAWHSAMFACEERDIAAGR